MTHADAGSTWRASSPPRLPRFPSSRLQVHPCPFSTSGGCRSFTGRSWATSGPSTTSTLRSARGEMVGLAGESGSGKSTLAYGAVPAAAPAGGDHRRDASPTGAAAARPEGCRRPRRSRSRQLRTLRWREIAIVFQSAMNALNPVLQLRDQLGDVSRRTSTVGRRGATRAARRRCSISWAIPRDASAELPPRALRRHAPAGDDRDGARRRPGGRDHGRADDGARRRRAARDPRADRRAARSELGFSVLFITHDLSLLLEIADRDRRHVCRPARRGRNRRSRSTTVRRTRTRGVCCARFPRARPRKELAGFPARRPTCATLPPGCPFVPRCSYATEACTGIDMRLAESPERAISPICRPARSSCPTPR